MSVSEDYAKNLMGQKTMFLKEKNTNSLLIFSKLGKIFLSIVYFSSISLP